jgi:hypothetical protein
MHGDIVKLLEQTLLESQDLEEKRKFDDYNKKHKMLSDFEHGYKETDKKEEFDEEVDEEVDCDSDEEEVTEMADKDRFVSLKKKEQSGKKLSKSEKDDYDNLLSHYDEACEENSDEDTEELEEGRDGIENLEQGHIALAKKKEAQGKLDDYVAYLKKNELGKFSNTGKDHYIKRLLNAIKK